MKSQRKVQPLPNSRNYLEYILLGLLLVAVLALIAIEATKLASSNMSISDKTSIGQVEEAPDSTDSNAVIEQADAQDDMLVYLIEEEKLAHDVYTAMYQLYGSRVFGNILNSEQTHQGRVLELLQARGIADPRSSELGVFNNSELQKLYDSLIAQGKKSEAEAYKVGVAIEEKDIADIAKQLSTATDSDVVTTLNALRSGSENHLRAFNRQIGRY